MQRQRNELVPIASALADLPGSVQALIPSRPTQRHFTRADQVNQLVSASEADADLRVAPRIVRIYTLRGFELVLAGSVQPGLLGDELA